MSDLSIVKMNILRLQKFFWFNALIKPFRFLKFIEGFIVSVNKGVLPSLIEANISPNLTNRGKIRICLDIIYSNLCFGASIWDYFAYGFYNLGGSQKKQFITNEMTGKYWHALNPPKYSKLLDQKNNTYTTLNKYFGREILYVSEKISYLSFADFVEKHKKVVIKPSNQCGGRGVTKVQVDNNTDLVGLYQDCLDHHKMLEEVIFQAPALAVFHPHSVNTIRINTMVTMKGVKIMSAAFRMGNQGSSVDNFHGGGIVAAINIESGVITTHGVDANHNRYSHHPLRNIEIKGYQIPNWQEILRYAVELASVVPKVRYVAWDLSLLEAGNVILVEANVRGDFELQQAADQIGKRKIYEEALKDI